MPPGSGASDERPQFIVRKVPSLMRRTVASQTTEGGKRAATWTGAQPSQWPRVARIAHTSLPGPRHSSLRCRGISSLSPSVPRPSCDRQPLLGVPATARGPFPDFRHLPVCVLEDICLWLCRNTQNGGPWARSQWSPLIRGPPSTRSAAVRSRYMGSSRNGQSVGAQVHPVPGGVTRPCARMPRPAPPASHPVAASAPVRPSSRLGACLRSPLPHSLRPRSHVRPGLCRCSSVPVSHRCCCQSLAAPAVQTKLHHRDVCAGGVHGARRPLWFRAPTEGLGTYPRRCGGGRRNRFPSRVCVSF